ncbi:hypothetical protein PR003_g18018 [Phytophthora rubi]|uniref:RxLR effector PexRD54 WY domain-containing protein n=2 Tax=Phytophthora rubi TaxID=129364 RepID=A0A6A4E3U6_9STRA|nr:hypothetical protein PR003_g18018 [Phytophthora rubi]
MWGYGAVIMAVALLVNADASFGQRDAAINFGDLLKLNIVSTSRLLRGYNTEDEERVGVPSSVVEKAKAMVMTTVSAEKLASWLNKGKSIDDVFTRLQLAKARDKLFDNPQFLTWLNYADDLTAKTGREASIIATLTAHYSDDVLAKIIGAAKQVENTQGIATRLEMSQVQGWLAGGKTADEVFTALKLDKAGDDILASPVFDTWKTYLKIFNRENPSSQTSWLASLTAHYGDDALAQIIQTAKKVGATRSEAVALETAQMQRWSGKLPDEVFTLLKLDKAGDDILSSPQFVSWNTYLKIFNKEHPDKKTSLFATLTAQYGDDGVSRIVEAALKTKSSSAIAKSIQAEQFQRWIVGGKSTNDVFFLLKLNKAGDDILSSPQLDTFTKYMKAFNKENPDNQKTLLATLTTHYDDEGLTRVLDAAKKVEATKSIATNLETAQIQHWLSARKTPDNVFTILNLDKAGDNLLASPLFTTFTKFTDAYHAENLGTKMTTSWIVGYHYNAFELAKMIIVGEKIPSSVKAAKRMEGVLFKDWMAAPNSPDHAFKALKLNQVGTKKLSKDPMFNYWMKFLDDFNTAFPGKNIERTILATTYKDQDLWKAIEAAKTNTKTKETANKLETEVLKQFIFAKKQPIDVAKVMNVKEKTDANWKLWKTYMKDFNAYHLRGIKT